MKTRVDRIMWVVMVLVTSVTFLMCKHHDISLVWGSIASAILCMFAVWPDDEESDDYGQPDD